MPEKDGRPLEVSGQWAPQYSLPGPIQGAKRDCKATLGRSSEMI